MITRRAAKAAAQLLGEAPQPPVDVVKLAEENRIRISYQPLEPNVSGLLLRGAGGTTIAVNQEHHHNRQRFTIAHELGHFLLHRGVFINSTVAVNLRAERHAASWAEEAEANAFAAELLMPTGAVINHAQRFLRAHPKDSVDALVDEIAATFVVSPQAAGIRLTTVGVLLSM